MQAHDGLSDALRGCVAVLDTARWRWPRAALLAVGVGICFFMYHRAQNARMKLWRWRRYSEAMHTAKHYNSTVPEDSKTLHDL